jgi:hypothetical protein
VSDQDYKIEKDNIYESADPRDDGRQILVTAFYTGYANANIVSHPSGKNHRSINVKYLHRDRNTGKGTPRKNGYFFVGKKQNAEATA